jgi:hypothetical protein
MWIRTGEQTGSGWAATGAVVELAETKTTLGQTIEIGRFNFTTETLRVGIAHIVDHDHEEIGFFSTPDRA